MLCLLYMSSHGMLMLPTDFSTPHHRSRWRHKISLLYWKHRNAYVQIRSDHPGWWESGFFCSWCHERPWLRSSESTTSFTNVSPWLFASNKHQVMCQVTWQNQDICRFFFPSHINELGDLEVISDCRNVFFFNRFESFYLILAYYLLLIAQGLAGKLKCTACLHRLRFLAPFCQIPETVW